jgi:adenylate cyclase
VALQERIAAWVLSTSAGHLSPTSDSLVQYLRGRTPADNARGLELAGEAWRDGKPYQVSVILFSLQQQSLIEGWAADPSRTLEEMVERTNTVLASQPNWGAGQVMLGLVSLLTGEGERATQALGRAVAMQGTEFPSMHAFLGLALAYTDRPEEALAALDEAIRLSPDDPERFSWEAWRGLAHFAAGRYPEARDAARLAISFNRNDHGNSRASAYQLLAASMAQLGALTEARSALEEAVRLRPALTTELAAIRHAASSVEHRERYVEGLRLAGLGEEGLLPAGADAGNGM